MTAAGQGLQPGAFFAELLLVIGMALLPPLFLVGLGYRLWRWTTTPDEQTVRKQAARREQLKRVVRRPAREMPLHDGIRDSWHDSDPAINEEGGPDD